MEEPKKTPEKKKGKKRSPTQTAAGVKRDT